MPQSPKGLATVAFLKARLDENQDHLGLFEPLIADGLRHVETNDFSAADLRDIVYGRTGLSIPVDTLQTVAGRFVKRGTLKRIGGRYFLGSRPVPDPSLDEARASFAADQDLLAKELVNFAESAGLSFDNPTSALSALAAFVSDNKVHLMLQTPFPESPLDRSSQERHVTRVIARFISQRCMHSESLRPALDGLVEGMIIEDTLLLRDIRDSAKLFTEFTVVLDTPLLFPALEMSSSANSVAVAEGLHLLRQAGARTIVFDTTLNEMRRILTVYEDKLPTTAGRLSLYPTDLSRFVLSSKMTAGDIRLVSAMLEQKLKQVGIFVRAMPQHDPRYTLDEKALAKRHWRKFSQTNENRTLTLRESGTT